MPKQIKEALLEKSLKAETATIGHKRHMGFANRNIQNIFNKKIGQSVFGNTNTVYVNPLNSLRFVLNKIRKEKVSLDKDFYVFTGSTVGVVPIKSKGEYIGKVDKLGTVRTTIN